MPLSPRSGGGTSSRALSTKVSGPGNHFSAKICADGPRHGQSSTVVQVIDNEVKVLREGVIDSELIYLATKV